MLVINKSCGLEFRLQLLNGTLKETDNNVYVLGRNVIIQFHIQMFTILITFLWRGLYQPVSLLRHLQVI